MVSALFEQLETKNNNDENFFCEKDTAIDSRNICMSLERTIPTNGMNVESISAELKASAQLNLEGGAQAVLKGGMVMIN